jgi:hypothetical protein
MFLKSIGSLCLVLFLSACAQTTITNGDSFIDPGWNGVKAKSMVVEVINAPLNERTAIENAMVQSLNKRNIRAVASHTILMPTRDYSNSKRQEILANSSYETHLTITPYNRDIIEHYTPPTRPFGTIGIGSGGYTSIGMGVGFGGGLHREEPIISYQTDLSVIKDNHKIWTSDYETRGPTGMSFKTIGKRFAIEITKKLAADGVI